MFNVIESEQHLFICYLFLFVLEISVLSSIWFTFFLCDSQFFLQFELLQFNCLVLMGLLLNILLYDRSLCFPMGDRDLDVGFYVLALSCLILGDRDLIMAFLCLFLLEHYCCHELRSEELKAVVCLRSFQIVFPRDFLVITKHDLVFPREFLRVTKRGSKWW